MKSKKLIVAVFAAVALLFSFGVAVEKASADSILFPWVVKSQTVTTLISVVNTSGLPTISSGNFSCLLPGHGPSLHYQYWYKGDNVTGGCLSQDTTAPTSENDLVTFDAAGIIGGGNAVFNDPTDYGDLSMSAAPVPSRAFLIVDNNQPCTDRFHASLYGEAVVIQLTAGAAWGYVAYNASRGEADEDEAMFFSDENDMQGEVLRSPRGGDGLSGFFDAEATPAVIYPLSAFKTKFFMTPANYYAFGQRFGGANARLQLCMDPSPVNTGTTTDPDDGFVDMIGPQCAHGGIFNNDEGEVSGANPLNIVCTAAVDISVTDALLNLAAINYLNSGRSAWAYVRSMNGTFQADPSISPNLSTRRARRSDMIVGKLDYSEATITIESTTIPTQGGIGAINTFNWIRNNISKDGQSLDHGINNIRPSDL